MKFATQLANDILGMQERIESLEHEVTRLMGYEEKYNALLNDSLAHSEKMVGGMLGLLMKPGVVDAIKATPEKQASALLGAA
jgi:hypothetical protein